MKISLSRLASCIVTLLICTALMTPQAAAESARASIDADCRSLKGHLTVPARKTATDFSVTLNSSWLPCGGTGHPERIGVKIIAPNGMVLYYAVKHYDGTHRVLAGTLKGLTLTQGTYTIEVPDGGKRTTAAVTYTLKGAEQNKWGSLSGEWSDPAVNSRATIVQTGNAMTITNTFVWNGKKIQWTGKGMVDGNNVQFNYAYTTSKPALWENGTMHLTRVGKDKLTGKWVTHSKKYQQAITFIKKRSDKPKTAAPPPASGGACGPDMIDRGDGTCIPRTIRIEVR